jgi:superfamily II DNA or RNA helicase
MSLDSLFAAVRAAASSQSWSRGVELARAEAVSGEREGPNEIALRVAARGGLASSPLAILYPDDDAWDCDCASREDVCEHVCAAVIATRRARSEGRALPEPERAGGRIGYRFRRSGASLRFERVIRTAAGEEAPLRASLAALHAGRVQGPAFTATPADLAIDTLLGGRSGELPRGLYPELLRALERCDDVRFDDRPIRASGAQVGNVARVEDVPGGGIRLRIAPDRRIQERFSEGVALCGDELCLLTSSQLSGRETFDYARGKVFDPSQLAELVTQVLPSLEKRIPIEIETRQLPSTVRAQPRIAIEVERRGDALSVLPLLVYGDPPLARVDAGRLVPLREGPIPLRDEAIEARLEQKLGAELQLRAGIRSDFTGAAAVATAEKLRRHAGEIRGRAHEQFFRAPPLIPELSVSDRGFALRFELESEGDIAVDGARRARGAVSVDAARVLRAWHSGESLVSLPGGGLAPLPADWLAKHGEIVSDLLAARSEKGEVPRWLLPDLARLCYDLDLPPPPALGALREILSRDRWQPGADVSRLLPADLRAELRAYQKDGVRWLCLLRDAGLGALLADDMGLGKTLQAICALRGRTLVVAPTSVLSNWADEIRRFRPGLSICTYHGASRALDARADVVITSYAILRLDQDVLARERWDAVILDEAQAIKNPESQAARAAYRLEAGFRLALTGTPVENRLDELWSQMHFALPGLLGSRSDFDERYARRIESGDAARAARLRERIRPFLLRRTKRDVAPELPPRTEVVLHPELTPDERAVYDAVRAATRRDVADRLGAGASPLALLEALLRLRQAACHPALLPGRSDATSSKVELLIEVLDESVADGHKALVFSQWTSLLDLVEPHLARAGIAFARLDGSTRDRAGVVAEFQSPGGPPVLLASLKAGGVGLNLTAADCVFILDPWWNPAAEEQAADRAHRIGQDKPVLVYRLVTQGSVEERVQALQRRKRELAQSALADASGAAALSRDDLLALLD